MSTVGRNGIQSVSAGVRVAIVRPLQWARVHEQTAIRELHDHGLARTYHRRRGTHHPGVAPVLAEVDPRSYGAVEGVGHAVFICLVGWWGGGHLCEGGGGGGVCVRKV